MLSLDDEYIIFEICYDFNKWWNKGYYMLQTNK